MRESNSVLCTDLLSNDNLVDVVELVPVLIKRIHVMIKGLKLGPPWNGHVQHLGSEEQFFVNKVAGIIVRPVRE